MDDLPELVSPSKIACMSPFLIPFLPDFLDFLADSVFSFLYLVRRFFLRDSAPLCWGIVRIISSSAAILSSSDDAAWNLLSASMYSGCALIGIFNVRICLLLKFIQNPYS